VQALLEDLQSIARRDRGSEPRVSGRAEFMPWDRAYWSAKQQSALFHFDAEGLRPFLPVNAVLSGLFSIAAIIFGIAVRERPTFCGSHIEDAVEVYRPDVWFFEVFDVESDRRIGGFFADLYAREDKQGGRWTDYIDVTGLAFLATDFQRPASGAFLNHQELVTLFHEFGHVCHALF
jgi:oligopeptidase A